MLNDAEFVESRLTSVRCFEKEKRVEFMFSLQNGGERIVAAEGVSRMLVQEMREQNIVERIDVYDSNSRNEDLQWAARVLAIPDDTTDPAAFTSVIESIVNQVITNGQVLIVITPVYGATVIALASKSRTSVLTVE